MDRLQRDKKLKAMLPVLVIVSIVVWIPSLTSSTSKQTDNEPGQDALSDNVLASDLINSLKNVRRQVKREVSIEKGWGRNPFVLDQKYSQQHSKTIVKKADTSELDVANITLDGIFFNNVKPSALLNDQIVGVGDTLDKYTVSKISVDNVILSDGNKNYELMLGVENE